MNARASRAGLKTFMPVPPNTSLPKTTAKAVGAVNTVVNRGGRLYGYNTDLAGMTAMLRRAGIDPSGKKALVLGTGGTSKRREPCLKASVRRALPLSPEAQRGRRDL